MTLNFAPWAIDGARSTAGLARLASYAAGGGKSGVIQPGDMRVTAKAVPGNGVLVSSGGAVILNHYLSNPDEAYVVSNPASHEVLSADMPASTPGTAYYLVCVVVGDPEFDQTGHPYMPSGPLDPEDAPDFEYVRMVIVPCSSSTTTVEDLGLSYPAYALARIERPGSTTTITNAMITDLRDLTRGRRDGDIIAGRPSAGPFPVDTTTSPASAWITFGDFTPNVSVPTWATKMQILTHVTGVGNSGAAVGEIRTVADNVGGATETYDIDAASARTTLLSSLEVDVTAVAGTTIPLKVQARQLFDLAGYAFADERTQITFDVRFSENVI